MKPIPGQLVVSDETYLGIVVSIGKSVEMFSSIMIENCGVINTFDLFVSEQNVMIYVEQIYLWQDITFLD